ncbi:hypothetical protein [Streptomyces sp. NPDC005799]|uniref:hypothetical protein n=1 Tax=Streptomyces sp. NPDC005799 TaxID=3154678 RepID=UPI0033FD3300
MTDNATEPATPPTGYHLLLPEDWVQIPLRQGDAEASVSSIVTAAFTRVPNGVPRDKLVPLRLELKRRLLAAVAEARKADVLELYVPMKLGGELNLGASFTVAQVRLPTRSGAGADPNGVSDPSGVAVQLLAGHRTAGMVSADMSSGEIDGAVAIRRERVVAAAPEHRAELASRRVEYLVAVPADAGQWLVVAFSTIGAGDPEDGLSEALVEWFDALMTTFRWSWT